MPWAKPVLMIIWAGLAAAPRPRRRYPASTSRSTSLPRGSPYPRSAAATSVQACLTAQAQSDRGKLDRSGTPGVKSAISGGSAGRRDGADTAGEPTPEPTPEPTAEPGAEPV